MRRVMARQIVDTNPKSDAAYIRPKKTIATMMALNIALLQCRRFGGLEPGITGCRICPKSTRRTGLPARAGLVIKGRLDIPAVRRTLTLQSSRDEGNFGQVCVDYAHKLRQSGSGAADAGRNCISRRRWRSLTRPVPAPTNSSAPGLPVVPGVFCLPVRACCGN